METPIVEVREVSKAYGTSPAVNRLSLDIRRGEFFSILGPSGSGKTTILRLLAGLERPDEGDIVIDGRSMHDVPPNQRPVNLVFQHYALFPHLTVFRNIAFGLEMQGLPQAEITSRVTMAMEMVKLQGKQQRLPTQLSGGEQQRVALARALVNHPAVVLLDEPLGALDQQLRQEMQVELKAIQESVGLTFICVTHHQGEALTMSDRVGVMAQGRLLQVGTPHEVYDAPNSAFVASFIGVTNCLRGRVASVDGARCTLSIPDLPHIVARPSFLVSKGSELSVAVRPERLHLSRNGQRDGFDNSIPVRIAKAIYSGHEMQYQLRLTDQVLW
ncbi:MAG: ABC transporter ATP-binding protein, partial [Nitrospiraceae bacterium]